MFLIISLTLAGGLIISGLYWRFACRRYSLPCPMWLAWILENPYTGFVAGSEKLLVRAAIEPGMKVLDLGCGPGRVTIPAAKRVGSTGEVVAFDIQAGMLERVQRKAMIEGAKNIRLLHGVAGKGHLESDSFDRVLMVTVLGEIPNREATLNEVFRALKPGGRLSITEIIPDPHYQTRSTLRRLASAAGFHEAQEFGNWMAFTINFIKPT